MTDKPTILPLPPFARPLTEAEALTVIEEVMDELVAEGTFRVAGTDDRGQKIYELVPVDQPTSKQ